MKTTILTLILILSINVLSAQNKRVVYEIDTALQTTQGFELPKSVILVDQQYIKGNPPKLGFDLSAFSDTAAFQSRYSKLTLKSAKTGEPFNGHNLSTLTPEQLNNFCLPTKGFIGVYKSIIAEKLEISEGKISVYECEGVE